MYLPWSQSSKCVARGKELDGVIILSLIHAGAARTAAADAASLRVAETVRRMNHAFCDHYAINRADSDAQVCHSLQHYRYVPLHTITYRYIPSHTVTYRGFAAPHSTVTRAAVSWPSLPSHLPLHLPLHPPLHPPLHLLLLSWPSWPPCSRGWRCAPMAATSSSSATHLKPSTRAYRHARSRPTVTTHQVPGILYGRYIKDEYGGGNPWVLISSALANLLYRAALSAALQPVDEAALAVWREALGPSFAGDRDGFVAAGDSVLKRVRHHVESDGWHLFEMIKKDTGSPPPPHPSHPLRTGGTSSR